MPPPAVSAKYALSANIDVRVWVPDWPSREQIGGLPVGVEVSLIPDAPGASDELPAVVLLVPQWGDRALLEALPEKQGLRVIQTIETGVDWIRPHVPDGVTLCNARGAYDVPVAEWVVAVILAAERRLPAWWPGQAQARWRRDDVPADDWPASPTGDLEGQRVLIVGHGSLGRTVERRLEPFGVELVRVARHARDGVHGVDDLPGLLPEADVVVVLVPLTSATRGLVDERFLAAMRPGALLVNAARGEVVDTDALLAASRERRVRAALDVTDPEPLPAGHPLWSAPNVLITPHIAGESQRRLDDVWRLIGEQIRRLAADEPPLNVVEGDY